MKCQVHSITTVPLATTVPSLVWQSVTFVRRQVKSLHLLTPTIHLNPPSPFSFATKDGLPCKPTSGYLKPNVEPMCVFVHLLHQSYLQNKCRENCVVGGVGGEWEWGLSGPN